MTDRFRHMHRHMSIRTRMALGVLVPLGMATAAVGVAVAPGATNPTLLSGALMLASIGTGLAMLQVNARALGRPLEEARLATKALARGDYRRRISIERMDETGRLLADIDDLGNYLAVMLPDEMPDLPVRASARVRPMSATPASPVALDRIVEQLREGGEDKDDGYDTTASVSRPTTDARQPRLMPDQA